MQLLDFEGRLAEYAQAIESFRGVHDLPSEWFSTPDHVAIKCADKTGYDSEMQLWLPVAVQAQFVEMNGRHLGSLLLSRPITAGNLGQVEWLEIMEPRPEKVGKDPVGIDHMEFIFSDFDAVASILNARGIAFERQRNPSHEWLSIVANGHEFKLTSTPLAEVVMAELAAGAAHSLIA